MKPYQTKSSKGYSKYKNERVIASYGEFDSYKEHRRYLVLLSLERTGRISDLKRQVPYTLIPSQHGQKRSERPVKYVADFVYTKDGKTVVEDVKGYRTAEYVIKRKLMLYIHGIEIVEV